METDQKVAKALVEALRRGEYVTITGGAGFHLPDPRALDSGAKSVASPPPPDPPARRRWRDALTLW